MTYMTAQELASANHYVGLLNTRQKRAAVNSVSACQQLIDGMEESVPHDELPRCYDYLVLKRNRMMGDLTVKEYFGGKR